jgi:hypothetical protein
MKKLTITYSNPLILFFLLFFLLTINTNFNFAAKNNFFKKSDSLFDNKFELKKIGRITRIKNNNFFINKGVESNLFDSNSIFFISNKGFLFSMAQMAWMGRKSSRLRVYDNFPYPQKNDDIMILNIPFNPHENFKTYLDRAEKEFAAQRKNRGLALLIYSYIAMPSNVDVSIILSEIFLKASYFKHALYWSSKGQDKKYPSETISRAYCISGMAYLGLKEYSNSWAAFLKAKQISPLSQFVTLMAEAGLIMNCFKIKDNRVNKELIKKRALRKLKALPENYINLLNQKLPCNWKLYKEFISFTANLQTSP